MYRMISGLRNKKNRKTRMIAVITCSLTSRQRMLTTTVPLIVGCTNDETASAESEYETDYEKNYVGDDIRLVHFKFPFCCIFTKIKGHPTKKQDTPIYLVVTLTAFLYDLKRAVGGTLASVCHLPLVAALAHVGNDAVTILREHAQIARLW